MNAVPNRSQGHSVGPKPKPQVVGILTQDVIDALGLTCSPSPILVGESNVKHMKDEHSDDFAMFGGDISSIIANPDFVALHPNGKSVEFIKAMEGAAEPILVAVRPSGGGVYYVRSLYEMAKGKLGDYLAAGTAKPWK